MNSITKSKHKSLSLWFFQRIKKGNYFTEWLQGKEYSRDKLLSCSDESRKDFTEEQAVGTQDGFAAIIFDFVMKI